jgi:hypothetical protein
MRRAFIRIYGQPPQSIRRQFELENASNNYYSRTAAGHTAVDARLTGPQRATCATPKMG